MDVSDVTDEMVDAAIDARNNAQWYDSPNRDRMKVAIAAAMSVWEGEYP